MSIDLILLRFQKFMRILQLKISLLAFGIFLGLPTAIFATDGEVKQANDSDVTLTIADDYKYSPDYRTTTGDVNGDGRDDIILHDEYHNVFLMYGSGAITSGNFMEHVAVKFAPGEKFKPNDFRLSFLTIVVKDINNDGYDDIVIGDVYIDVYRTDDPTILAKSNGAVFIQYGKKEQLSGTVLFNNMDARMEGDVTDNSVSELPRYKFQEKKAYGDSFGCSLAIFDFNSDGINDIAVGARGDDDGGYNAGAAYIFLGRTEKYAGIRSASEADIEYVGEPREAATDEDDADEAKAGTMLGTEIAGGDLNNDGIMDLVVASSMPVGEAKHAGQIFVVAGSKNPSLGQINTQAAAFYSFKGTKNGQSKGGNVLIVADVNADKKNDLLLNSNLIEKDRSDKVVIQGRNIDIIFDPQPSSEAVTEADVTIQNTGSPMGENFAGQFLTDDINNDGAADITSTADFFIGQQPDKYKSRGQGAVYVFHGGSDFPTTGTKSTDTFYDTKYVGEFGAGLGTGLGMGDVNGDGAQDTVLVQSGANIKTKTEDPFAGDVVKVIPPALFIDFGEVASVENVTELSNGRIQITTEIGETVKTKVFSGKKSDIASTIFNENNKAYVIAVNKGKRLAIINNQGKVIERKKINKRKTDTVILDVVETNNQQFVVTVNLYSEETQIMYFSFNPQTGAFGKLKRHTFSKNLAVSALKTDNQKLLLLNKEKGVLTEMVLTN